MKEKISEKKELHGKDTTFLPIAAKKDTKTTVYGMLDGKSDGEIGVYVAYNARKMYF
jgi:hypothetical protein